MGHVKEITQPKVWTLRIMKEIMTSLVNHLSPSNDGDFFGVLMVQKEQVDKTKVSRETSILIGVANPN